MIVKRARAERSLAYEANVMELVRGFGVAVPKVHEVRADDTEIVSIIENKEPTGLPGQPTQDRIDHESLILLVFLRKIEQMSDSEVS